MILNKQILSMELGTIIMEIYLFQLSAIRKALTLEEKLIQTEEKLIMKGVFGILIGSILRLRAPTGFLNWK